MACICQLSPKVYDGAWFMYEAVLPPPRGLVPCRNSGPPHRRGGVIGRHSAYCANIAFVDRNRAWSTAISLGQMGSVPMFCLLAATDDSHLVVSARLGADCFGNLLTHGNRHDCDRRLSFSGRDGGGVEGEKQRPPLARGRHCAAGRCTASGCFSSEPSPCNCSPLNEVSIPRQLRAWIVPPRVAESQKGCWRKIA